MRVLFQDCYGSEPMIFSSVEAFIDYCDSEEIDFSYEYNGGKNEAFYIPDDLQRVVVIEQPRYRVADEPVTVAVPTLDDDLPLQDMEAVLRLFDRRNPEDSRGHYVGGHHAYVHGRKVTALGDVPNDYYADKLPFIPKGSEIILDFGGDFGFYGTAIIGGVVHRIKVDLPDLHRIDWRDLI